MSNPSGRKPVPVSAVVSTNRNFRVTGWSGEAEALYGWAEDEAKGRNIDELLRTDYAGSSLNNVFSTLLSHGWAEIETGHTTKSGESLKISDTVTLLRDGSGEITGMVHMLRRAGESTGSEREPAALRERDRELLDLLTGAADDLWVYDIPEDAQEQIGFSPKGAPPGGEGDETAGMVHPDDWERVDAAIREAMADKREWFRVQCRTLSAGGEYVWSLTQGKIRYDGDGKPVRLSGMTIGVSEVKNLEIQLQEQAKALEKQAQEKAGRDKLAVEFFSNISHEIKTPLSVMLMDLQMMERRLKDPADGKEALMKSVAATRRNALKLLRLIGNLTDLMKIEAGKMKARLVNADIVEVVSGVVESAAGYAKEMGIEISFESPCASRTVPLDAEKLERVLLNLLSNSVKHTPPGGHVLVRLRDAPDLVAISVKDDGKGIPDALKGVVFERFKQANLYPALGGGNVGLGLPLAKALVELLRGRIWFDSAAGQGCEFFVALPVLQPDWQAPPLDTDGMPMERKVEMEFTGVEKTA